MLWGISARFMAGVAGLEPTNGGSKPAALPTWLYLSGYMNVSNREMAGVAGLEPTDGGIKTRCLTNLAIPQCLYKQANGAEGET